MRAAIYAITAVTLLGSSVMAQTPRPPSSACTPCHSSTESPPYNHPVGIDYEAARWRHALRPVTAPSGLGSTVAADLLVSGRVECASCHATHEEESTTPYRLRLPDPNRQPIVPGVRVVTTSLCGACHDRSKM